MSLNSFINNFKRLRSATGVIPYWLTQGLLRILQNPKQIRRTPVVLYRILKTKNRLKQLGIRVNHGKYEYDFSLNGISKTLVFPLDICVPPLILEIFKVELYQKLRGGQCVLVLGGCYGESAVYLAAYNDRVIVLEPSHTNFHYLSLNITKCNNITGINAGVVADGDNTSHFIQEDLGVRNLTVTEPGMNLKTSRMEIIHISTLLDEYRPDILQMDCEGAEWPIIKQRTSDPSKFGFSKGMIEFHNIPQYSCGLIAFENMLVANNYEFSYVDNHNKVMRVNKDRTNYANMYFEKSE